MKLPPASIRAGFKFEDPAQKLLWAAHTYLANVFKSPRGSGSTRGELSPPSEEKSGVDPEVYPWYQWAWRDRIDDYHSHMTYFQLNLPYDPTRYARGYEIRDCLLELTQGVPEPLLESIVPAGSPIPDESNAETLEQYIFDNFLLYAQDRVANPVTLPPGQGMSGLGAFLYRYDWTQLGQNSITPVNGAKNLVVKPAIFIEAHILRKPARQRVNDFAGDEESRFKPHDFCSFSRYNTLANP